MRKIKLSEQQLIDDIKQFYSDFNDFNPGQKECIEAILSGRDLVAVMPTGGGKSLCYQYPATKLKGVTIIVSPLISLMQDQADSLAEKGVKTLVINSAQGNKGEMIDKMKDA
ncbi:MAG: DEAD/DEAH box helicase, partial [Acutalibacteraceae bacterium]